MGVPVRTYADAAFPFELHIEPSNPRAAVCTISAALLTSVPACSCTPSSDLRCPRDGCRDDEVAVRLVGDSLRSSVPFGLGRVVEMDGWSCDAEIGDDTGCAVCAGSTAIRNAATGELAGVG